MKPGAWYLGVAPPIRTSRISSAVPSPVPMAFNRRHSSEGNLLQHLLYKLSSEPLSVRSRPTFCFAGCLFSRAVRPDGDRSSTLTRVCFRGLRPRPTRVKTLYNQISRPCAESARGVDQPGTDFLSALSGGSPSRSKGFYFAFFFWEGPGLRYTPPSRCPRLTPLAGFRRSPPGTGGPGERLPFVCHRHELSPARTQSLPDDDGPVMGIAEPISPSEETMDPARSFPSRRIWLRCPVRPGTSPGTKRRLARRWGLTKSAEHGSTVAGSIVSNVEQYFGFSGRGLVFPFPPDFRARNSRRCPVDSCSGSYPIGFKTTGRFRVSGSNQCATAAPPRPRKS